MKSMFGIEAKIREIIKHKDYEDGYRLDEVRAGETLASIHIVDVDDADEVADNADSYITLGNGGKNKLTIHEAAELKRKACQAGILSKHNPIGFPVKRGVSTTDVWESACEEFRANPSFMESKPVLLDCESFDAAGERDKDSFDYCKETGVIRIGVPNTIGYSELSVNKRLRDHLEAGYCAYIKFGIWGEVLWATVPDKFAEDSLQDEKERFSSLVNDWRQFKSDVENAMLIQDALAQERRFEKLPFDWGVSIKQVLSGLSESSMGNGCNASTVTHLYAKSAFESGRYKRDAGEYLCTQPKGRFNAGCDNLTHALECAGVTVKNVPYVVTCKDCLQRAERMLS